MFMSEGKTAEHNGREDVQKVLRGSYIGNRGRSDMINLSGSCAGQIQSEGMIMKLKKPGSAVRAVIVMIVLSMLLGGCGLKSIRKAGGYSKDFNQFSDQVFAELVSFDEVTLHSILLDEKKYGIEGSESSWGSYSAESFESEYDLLEKINDHLKTFDYDQLTDGQKVTYDLLNTYLTGELSIRDDYLLYEPMNPMLGDHLFLAYSLDTYQIDNSEDLEMYFVLVKDIKPYVESICEFEREKSEAGLFMIDSYAETVITDCQEIIDEDAVDFISGFEGRLEEMDFLSDTEKEDYKEQNRQYVSDYVIPAYQNIIDTLSDLLGTGEEGTGLSRFDGGKEYYTRQLQMTTGTDMTTNEMFALLEEKAILWQDEFEAASDGVDYMLLSSAFDNYTTPEDVINNNLTQMTSLFPELSDLPDPFYEIAEMPESIAEFAAGMYMLPQVDDVWHNVFYISESSSVGMDLYNTTSHECVPGHLYQTVSFLTSDHENLPLRYLLSSYGEGLGTEEGWTTYIETVSYEMAGLPEPEKEYMQKYYNGIYAWISLLDIGVNYYGWSMEEAEEYFSEKGLDLMLSPNEELIEMVDTMPTMYLSYTVGYIQLSDMMERAQEELGDKFSLYEFHKFYMDAGPSTFEILNREMDAWIEAQN